MDEHPYLFLVFSPLIFLSAANYTGYTYFSLFGFPGNLRSLFFQVFFLYLQEKQALEKRVSNME